MTKQNMISERAHDAQRVGGRTGPVPSNKHQPGIRPFFELQQTIGNQAMLQLLEAGMIQAKLRDSQPGQGLSSVTDCSGWEGEHYLRRVWQPAWGVASVRIITPPPDRVCKLIVNAGKGQIILTVKLSPADKIVKVGRDPDPNWHMHRYYLYRCSTSNQLVFSGPECPEF
jgi:hypothetical protein